MIRPTRIQIHSILLLVISLSFACQSNSISAPPSEAPPILESRQEPKATPTVNAAELLSGPETDFRNASVGTTWVLEEAISVLNIPSGFNPTNYETQDIEIANPGSTFYILERHGAWHRVRVDEPGFGVREGWIWAEGSFFGDRWKAKELR